MKDNKHTDSYIFVSYPLLLRRYQASLIDFLLLGVLSVSLVLIFNIASVSSQFIVFFVALLWLSYEPILSVYLCTLGQHVMGIRVRDGHDPFMRITLWQSYRRFFIKYLLGWLSFITIHQNEQKRALHDFAGQSVVVCNEGLD